MATIIFFLAVLLVLCWTISKFVLSGADHSQFDQNIDQNEHFQIFDAHPDDLEHRKTAIGRIVPVRKEAIATRSFKKGLQVIRDFADNLSSDLESDCEFRDINANGVSAEWVIAPNTNTNRRILFFHGGAFALGCAKGHRHYTHRLSHLANAAVLSVNYRMLPEHSRRLANKDAQDAYRWILDNGPEGVEPIETLLVAGDSAGGNLTLMLAGWSKTEPLRKPDGVICFSPSADLTIRSPTIKANRATDPILANGLGPLSKIPKTIGAWVGLFLMRANPANPLNSPLFGDLSDLPPTLIQASDCEMLLGESIRYTNKALAAGSDVRLQIWKNQIHDWQLFSPESGSGKQAFAEVDAFIKSLDSSSTRAKAS